jgi:hypothetical protein
LAIPERCVSFGFLAKNQQDVQCELYQFSERYAVVVDESHQWQYWMRRDTPNVSPVSTPLKRAVPALLAAPVGNVALGSRSLFARSMAISIDYLLRNYHVDNMLWWFRDRAGLPQPSTEAAAQGWDRCVNNIRGGDGHLCLKGSVASTFLMGAGGQLRWQKNTELRRRFDAVLAGIKEAAAASGFCAAYAENETMYRENPNYVLAWLTHGLLEAEVVATADSKGVALSLARGMIDWFSDLSR